MTVSAEQPQRRTVYYQGQVQGVGFRATARRAAAHREVTGYVQNLPDGRVRLVAEGTAAELDALLEDIRRRLGDYIRHTEVQVGPASGEFAAFDIRY